MAKRGTPAFTDPQELDRKIEAYFQNLYYTVTKRGRGAGGDVEEWEEELMRPPTMAGLALALGVDRVTLLHYKRGDGMRDPSFIPIIEKAVGRIAEFAETCLYDAKSARGAQFALQVNHRYGQEISDDKETATEFSMKVIAPAASEAAQLAIPKWDNEGE